MDSLSFTGTSACACALSSSFDSLTGNAIATAMSESIGTIFGELLLITYNDKRLKVIKLSEKRIHQKH